MTNQDKVIKDLKQRNDKLVNQSRQHEIREYSYAYRLNKIKKSLEDIHKHVQTIESNCDGDQLTLCECNLIEEEIQKCLSYGLEVIVPADTNGSVTSMTKDNSTT